MVSLKDIAAKCEVSVATVSKALNNHSDISEQRREYIKRVAKEMGYSPNISARALKTNRTYNIGVLFVDESTSGLTHDFFAAILDSFKSTAEQAGYDITFINCNKSRQNSMTYLEHCRYRGFDGVMVACIDFEDPEVIELVKSDIPVVTIDYVFDSHITIISNNHSGITQLVEYAFSQGHRKIAYIHGYESSVTVNRLTGFYGSCERLGIDVDDDYIQEVPYRDTVATYEATKKLLDLPKPPTCILYPDDFAAFGGIKAIRERGLSIPEDISIAGYDGIQAAFQQEPPLTTIKQDARGLGREAAEGLVNLIERPKTTVVRTVIMPVELIEGGTVKPPKKA